MTQGKKKTSHDLYDKAVLLLYNLYLRKTKIDVRFTDFEVKFRDNNEVEDILLEKIKVGK